MTLLEETIATIAQHRKSIDDIKFIGSVDSGHSCTWDEFTELANQEYDHGFGSQEVATDLVIIFSDDSYLERYEYDGSEWWTYCTKLVIPTETKQIASLFAPYGYNLLSEIHNEEIEND